MDARKIETFIPCPTTLDAGLYPEEQFELPVLDLSSTDFGLMTVATSGNQRNRDIGFYGLSGNQCCFKSGIELDYDDLIDNVPIGTSLSQAVTLYEVEYPDSHADNSDVPDRLVIKAYRSAEYESRAIGTTGKYGTYININLGCYRVRTESGVETEEQINNSIVNAMLYKPEADDVTLSKHYLEFFYFDEGDHSEGEMWDYIFGDVLSAHFAPNDQPLDCVLMLGVSTTAHIGVGYWHSYRLWLPVRSFLDLKLKGNPSGKNVSPAYGEESDPDGYDGTHDFHSDRIGRPFAPTTSVLSPGFINAYKVTTSLLTRLGSALFPENVLSMDATGLTEIQAMLKCFRYLIDTQYNKDALDFVISCHILPVNVPTGASAHISVGGKELKDPSDSSYYSASTVGTAYVTKSCGSVTIPEAFGNFLDYTVKCKLYLPFYGYVDIPPEYWNGGTIAVEYMFNVLDGTFVAFVSGTAKHSNLNSLIGQYSGVAVTHIPLRGADYSTIVAGIVSTTAGLAGTVASGGNPMVGGAVASSLGSMIGCKPNLVSNGSANSSSAMMMRKTPYLIIEYPTPQFSTQYPNEKGLPLNVSGTLGQYGGMTIAENPVLSGIPCTEREKERIRNALKTGLIF